MKKGLLYQNNFSKPGSPVDADHISRDVTSASLHASVSIRVEQFINMG